MSRLSMLVINPSDKTNRNLISFTAPTAPRNQPEASLGHYCWSRPSGLLLAVLLVKKSISVLLLEAANRLDEQP